MSGEKRKSRPETRNLKHKKEIYHESTKLQKHEKSEIWKLYKHGNSNEGLKVFSGRRYHILPAFSNTVTKYL